VNASVMIFCCNTADQKIDFEPGVPMYLTGIPLMYGYGLNGFNEA
jgi:hypothetical protein